MKKAEQFEFFKDKPTHNIKDFPLSKLTLLEKNPRRITQEQLEKLEKSLIDDPSFLMSRPILVNHKNDSYMVYGGNQRVRVARKLKWKTIPCAIEEDLSDHQMNQRIIKDNKTYGEFDYESLANEWDVSILRESGFTEAEIPSIEVEQIKSESESSEISSDSEIKEEKEKPKCPSCGQNIN